MADADEAVEKKRTQRAKEMKNSDTGCLGSRTTASFCAGISGVGDVSLSRGRGFPGWAASGGVKISMSRSAAFVVSRLARGWRWLAGLAMGGALVRVH